MKIWIIVFIIFLIPLVISPLLRNYYRYKKNLPLEKNIYGRIIKKLCNYLGGYKKF